MWYYIITEADINELRGKQFRLLESDLLRRQNDNNEYLLKLKNEHLLCNYYLEAGMLSIRGFDNSTMGGWESSTCQLRGHFLGHLLSAAALHYEAYQDNYLKAKVQDILDELEKCQEYNGGKWVCSIPEKYLTLIAQGKGVCAPKQKLKARLGDKNQEHCTVYNMIRLANILFLKNKRCSILTLYRI